MSLWEIDRLIHFHYMEKSTITSRLTSFVLCFWMNHSFSFPFSKASREELTVSLKNDAGVITNLWQTCLAGPREGNELQLIMNVWKGADLRSSGKRVTCVVLYFNRSAEMQTWSSRTDVPCFFVKLREEAIYRRRKKESRN